MVDGAFRLPGFERPLKGPESYVTGMLRAFELASQALGYSIDRLVVRLSGADGGGSPDYQIQTIDGEDAAVFAGDTHDFRNDDITVRLEEDELQDQSYSVEQVKDWLNVLNGEGPGGGRINPILSTRWLDGDASDPRD